MFQTEDVSETII